MVACRNSSENGGKMNLKPILNKTPPWPHTELELDVLGVLGKLIKYVVHLFKKIWKKIFFFIQATQATIDQFLVSRNFRKVFWKTH
jgi:hypothetical protein